MPQYDAGTAAIKVKPNLTGFATEVENRLRTMDFHVDVNLGIDTRVAAAEMAAFRRAAGDNVTFRVDADTRVAATEIAGLRAAARERLTIPVDVDGSSTARARARAGLNNITRSLRDAASINIGVIGVIGAAGVLADLAAIAGAAAKVTQTIAIGPAIGFGGLAGIASVATGLNGIPAAFKAAGAASKDAAAAAQSQRDALGQVADAEYRAQQADRAHIDSLRDLNTAYKDAGRSIRDMNVDLEEQKLSTEDAALSVQEAARRLAEVQNDPRADYTTRARADLSYRQAINRLQQQQNKTQDLAADTEEANARGVEGSDEVTSAKARVADATHAQTQAERELAKARQEAASPSGAQAKLDQAMAKLSPNAKQLVNDVRAIGPAWSEARRASQDALTEMTGPAVTRLAEQQLPNVRDGMVGINSAINSGLRGSIAALSSDQNKVDFKITLDRTTQAFQNAARGSEAWTTALTKLVTVGSEFLPQLGDAIANAGERFNALIQRTAADGSLKKWMQDGVDTGKTLASIALNVGSSIRSVFRAAGDDGETLRKLDDLTERMARFLKSTEGQDQLKRFFAESRENLDRIKPLLEDLPGILKAAFDGMQAWGGVMLPILRAAATLLEAHPGLVQTAVIAYLAFKTVGPIFDLVRNSIASTTLALERYRTTQAAAAAGGSGAFRSSLSGVAAFLGPGGIFTVALAGAAIGLSLLAQRHQEASRAAAEQRAKLEQLGQTLDAQTGRATAETIATASEQLGKEGYLTRAESFGINTTALVRASLGVDPQARDEINQQITKIILEQQQSAGAKWSDVQLWTGLTDEDIAKALQGVPEAVTKYADALRDARKKIAESGGEQTLPDLTSLKESLNDVGESAATLGGRMNDLNSSTGKLGEQRRQIEEARVGTHQFTEQGRRDFEALGIAIDKVTVGEKTIHVNALTEEQQKKLRDLGNTVQQLPDGTFKITLDDAQAKAQIQQITTAPYEAQVKIKWDFDQINVEARRALNPGSGDYTTITGGHVGGRTSGGRLPSTGPGTERTDGILGMHTATGAPISWLDGGEWIINRRSSTEYNGELAAINAGTFPKHRLPGYETGGVIDERPQKATIGPDGNIVYPSQAGKGKQSPIGRSAELINFARSLDGKPYGGNFDCSGVISQAANVAVGLPPNSGRMATSNEGQWLSALGWLPGTGTAGSFRVGWINDPNMAAGGHTAGTLPNNVNFESGGATSKVMYGGQAIGANHPMFIDHAYLVMDSSAGTGGNPGTGTAPAGTPNATEYGTESVLYPQAPPVGRVSDQELQRRQNEAAVDQANSERNQVYANPAATDRDRLAADAKLQQAQNARESGLRQQSGDNSAISLQGIFSKAGSILATGILSAFGLENSILSETNVYNRAFNSLVTGLSQQNGQLGGGGYGYEPKNLPQIVTTQTPQSSATVNDPALSTQIPGSGPTTGAPAINPNLGSGTITVPAPGRGSYQVGAGAEQWRGLATQMLIKEGFDPGQVDIMLAQIQSESGGNPSIVQQVQDVNSGGNEAVGLLQVIPGTFAQYRDPALPNDRTNPAANMSAALRYYRARYGSDLRTMWGQGHGYADGGWIEGIGGSRSDSVPIMASRDEFMVNAYDARRNAPVLEAINAGQWSPMRLDPAALAGVGAAAATRGGNSISTTIVEPRVANLGDLVDLAERSNHMKAIGLMAALP